MTEKRVIIVFEEEAELGPSVLALPLAMGGTEVIKQLPIINGVVAEIPEAEVPALEIQGNVKYVEEDYPVYMVEAIPQSDIIFPVASVAMETPVEGDIQWNMNVINAPEAWKANKAQKVKVGVIDTGIASDHPDFLTEPDNGPFETAIKGGFNAIDGGSYEDDNNHGTYCASVVGARRNGVGIIGVAPKCWLYSVKVLDKNGSGYSSDVVQGYEWAIANDIQVVNLSLGSAYRSQAMADAMLIAAQKGMGTVAATGNDGRSRISYPARNYNALCVGATGTNGKRKNWSNYGAEMETRGIMAPGDYVLSANRTGGWQRVAGTSIATPHVTGLVALLVGMGGCRRSFIFESAAKKRPTTQEGYGLIDAMGAIEKLIEFDERFTE